MQAHDDSFQRSGVHHHLIAPGRGAGSREELDCHLVANCHRARVRQLAPRPQIGKADELGQSDLAVLTYGFGREQRDDGCPVGQ